MENANRTNRRDVEARWDQRGQALKNILKMGHCAPAVMKSILDHSSTEQEWLVKLSAGMPGGIGNTGGECGAVTSPLVLLGVRYGLSQADDGLPAIFERGHAYCRDFMACHRTLDCREIRGRDRFPWHCISPVTRSAERTQQALNGNSREGFPEGLKSNYGRLYSHFEANKFHCAQSVLTQLDYNNDEQPELLRASSAFVGGTLLMGRTCSAFTAAVMAIGLSTGEIEDSFPRVARMLAIMTAGGNAFDERINKFNSSMNLGFRMSRWFAREFSSTQCQGITHCDFSEAVGVDKFIENQQIERCREIAGKTAERVNRMIGERRKP